MVNNMTFDELIIIKPNIRVADIIQLFLLSNDDKVYLNLARYNNGFEDYILKDERIIHDEWVKYYECKVKWIEEENTSVYPDLAEITLFIK